MKIYRIKNRGRDAYQCAYWIAGRRHLKNFAKLAAARTHAEEQATLINSGFFAVARMKDTDREGFVAAGRIAREAGAPLLDAVKSYAAAMKALAGTGGLLEAAKEYATRHASQIKPMSVAEAVAAFVANKRATPGLDARYVANVENAANRFAEAFKQQLAALGAEDVQRWIRAKRDGKALGWKRQNDLRSLIVEIAKFAKKKGALPPGGADALEPRATERCDQQLRVLRHGLARHVRARSGSRPDRRSRSPCGDHPRSCPQLDPGIALAASTTASSFFKASNSSGVEGRSG